MNNNEADEDLTLEQIREYRETYVKKHNYSLKQIIDDLQAKQVAWEALGIKFINSVEESTQNDDDYWKGKAELEDIV